MTKEKENMDIISAYPDIEINYDTKINKEIEQEIKHLDDKIQISLREIRLNNLTGEDNSTWYRLLDKYTVRRDKLNSKLIELYDEIGF